ncbi:MAG: primosomal protein N' [Kiritimatiellae bacterium]|nr:primosomal protein N' [Kiritimatiellia bacterium]
MPRIAKVVVDIALDREFDYLIPDHLHDGLRLGSRVLVPFGRSESRGYVVGLASESAFPSLKTVKQVIGPKPLVDEPVLALARWLGAYYAAPVEHAIRAVLPGAVRRAGAGFKEQLFVSPVAEAAPDEAALALLEKRCPKQAAVLAALRRDGGRPMAELTRELGTGAAVVRALAEKGFVRIGRETAERDPFARQVFLPTDPLALMPEQRAALDLTRRAIETRSPPVVLLYGVTGSGKTEVYLQAIAHVLDGGGGAIVLVPEISLTPQTVERFKSRFGDNIAVLHSHLSEGERHDEWHRVREGKARIAIGARSAVFAPVRKLGLIVVDEEHEPTYKQDESPRYNARDVAVMRGHMQACAVLLASATPALESYFNAKRGKYGLAVLPRRVDNRTMPVMRIVDMRLEAERVGRPTVLSGDLIEAIHRRIDRAEQTMLFLNRRGYSTALICRKCGYVAQCHQCSVSLTYHKSVDQLHCHMCGAVKSVPGACPECRDPAFKYTGVGTQRVESVIAKVFPHARIRRMDSDAVTRKDAYREILGDFKSGRIDILIGTQMIAKGLHFPNVTLIGVVYADLGLHLPDFRASERTFQLLTQVAGRAGRGEVQGEVIVQTYTPFNTAIQAARRLDYEGFCDQELEFRRELNYPPFTHLVCLTVKGASEEKVAFSARALSKALESALAGNRVFLSGATPAPLARIKGAYRYQIMVRGPSVRAITPAVNQAVKASKWPAGVSCSVDVDAFSLL